MIDAAVMRNLATRAKLKAFARAGGGVAGDIEVIPVRESWCFLVVAPGEGAAEGTVGRVCKAIGQAARRLAAVHISMPLESPTYEQQLLMYGKQLKKGRGQRGVEKEAKPSIMADLLRAVSKHGVDLWLDAFCLRGHVGEIAVKKAVEAVLETELKKKYPGLLAKRRIPDAPSSTVDGAGPPDLAPPKSRPSEWDSGSFSSSGTASFPSRNTTGAPAGAAAGSKTSAQSSAASPARARQTAGTTGHVGVGGGSCGDGVGAFPAFSFGTTASGPPARAWDMETFATAGHAEDLDKVSRFVEFFQNVFGEVDIVVDEAESVVKCWWGHGDRAINTTVDYLEHGIRVCREGPWQPASFSLMQARIPTHPAESGTSRLVLSAGVPHPSDKWLRELSAVYGIVAANVKVNCLKAQPPPPPPPSSGDGADIGLSGARHRHDGLPQSFAPPSVEAASDRVKVAQLWGLHDNVQAALDRLVVGPDKNAVQEKISLRLGQRNLEQLASTGWIRTLERRRAKVELYQQRGTIRVTRLHIIAASLVEALPRSVQLVDMIDAAVMRNVATPANLEAFARAGGGVAGDIEVIPVRESWRLLVVAPGEEPAEGTVDRVCKAIGQAARRWADAHVSVPLNPQMYVKQLHKNRWQRGVEKDSKPPIIADLSRAVSKHGVDLWLDAFCLRGHVGDMTVKKAVEAVLRTKLKKKYPGLLAKLRVPDAPSSTVDGAGPPDLSPPKSRASAWDSGSFSNFAIAAGASPAAGGLCGAPAGAGPKMLTLTSVELPAGTGDGAAGASSAAAPSSGAGAGATATAGHLQRRCWCFSNVLIRDDSLWAAGEGLGYGELRQLCNSCLFLSRHQGCFRSSGFGGSGTDNVDADIGGATGGDRGRGCRRFICCRSCWKGYGEPVGVEQGMDHAAGTSLPCQAPQQESVGEREGEEEKGPRGTKRRRGKEEEDQQQEEEGGGEQGGRRERRTRRERKEEEEEEEGEEGQGEGGG
ncbi:hypothetical protein Esi_0073_0052 [Ectocarpus siliculosus]|uniref:Uncharacterized protein n=1 Tax=Ectocarpus siliculosus TaxID=2880 RepID=D7G697_ECTSI|nr:hypothetical protein Esi_0073_0052 [Ectocarpus siliculosus]|eukprot:CBJ27492.1 hypothetical protein Esi_0073_0052 [Ectocarpus siliculosus]